jgi:hypothetical protein
MAPITAPSRAHAGRIALHVKSGGLGQFSRVPPEQAALDCAVRASVSMRNPAPTIAPTTAATAQRRTGPIIGHNPERHFVGMAPDHSPADRRGPPSGSLARVCAQILDAQFRRYLETFAAAVIHAAPQSPVVANGQESIGVLGDANEGVASRSNDLDEWCAAGGAGHTNGEPLTHRRVIYNGQPVSKGRGELRWAVSPSTRSAGTEGREQQAGGGCPRRPHPEVTSTTHVPIPPPSPRTGPQRHCFVTQRTRAAPRQRENQEGHIPNGPADLTWPSPRRRTPTAPGTAAGPSSLPGPTRPVAFGAEEK